MSDRKSVLITGAASGIGLAAAQRFAREGWFVGLSDIDEKGLDAALKSLGNGAGATFKHDVRDEAIWRGVLEDFFTQAGGRLDVLVNNAGIATYDWFDPQSLEQHFTMLDINVKGVILGAYLGLPYLRKTPGARLINIASQASMTASPRLAVYSATKYAVRGLSEALDVEFMRFGVRVGCIMPGLIDTPLLDKAQDAQGRTFRAAMAQQSLITPETVGNAIWECAHGDHIHYGVGDTAQAQAEPLRAHQQTTRETWGRFLTPRQP